MKRVRLLVCALSVLFLAPGAMGQEAPAAKASAKQAAPTVVEAKKFLDEAEKRYFDLSNKAQRAEWVYENFITDDTEGITAEAGQELNAFSAEMSKKAHRFDGLRLPPEMARKMLLLKLSTTFPAPADPKEQKELAQVLASLSGDYGKGKWCPDGPGGKCLDITAIERLLATSRDPEELRRAWVGWHAVGAPMRQRYARMVELGNKGSRELGFADAGALWRSNYDMPPDQFAKEEDRLWGQLRPLYESLHAYVRGQLRKKYGGELVHQAGGPGRGLSRECVGCGFEGRFANQDVHSDYGRRFSSDSPRAGT